MKQSHETGWVPPCCWPDNPRLLAIFSHPVTGEAAAEGLAWWEWQDHSAATRMALRAP